MSAEAEFLAGFYGDLEKLGEDEVRRRLPCLPAGEQERASNWLDIKEREAAQTKDRAAKWAESRANLAMLALPVIAITLSVIAIINK